MPIAGTIPPTQPLLALVTNRQLLPPFTTLAQAIAPAVTGGTALVLLAETDLPRAPRRAVVRFAMEAIRGRAELFLLRDEQLAREMSCAGVVVESGLESASGIAPLLKFTREEGGLEQVGCIAGLDWSNPERALALLSDMARSAPSPVFAGWDVPLQLAARCVEVGAHGVCACSAVMQAGDPAAVVREYRAAIGPAR